MNTYPTDKILKQIIKDLKLKFNENLVSIVLFGSYARNISEEYSDIDLLVIYENLKFNLKEKNELEFDLSWEWQERFNKKIDLTLMSRDDAIANFDAHSPLFSTFVLGIKIFFDKEQFFLKKYTAFLEEMKIEDYFYTDSKNTWDLSQKANDLLNSHENFSELLSTI